MQNIFVIGNRRKRSKWTKFVIIIIGYVSISGSIHSHQATLNNCIPMNWRQCIIIIYIRYHTILLIRLMTILIELSGLKKLVGAVLVSTSVRMVSVYRGEQHKKIQFVCHLLYHIPAETTLMISACGKKTLASNNEWNLRFLVKKKKKAVALTRVNGHVDRIMAHSSNWTALEADRHCNEINRQVSPY